MRDTTTPGSSNSLEYKKLVERLTEEAVKRVTTEAVTKEEILKEIGDLFGTNKLGVV